MKKKSIVLLGAGGHCVSVIDVIELGGEYNIIGILDYQAQSKDILGYPIIGNDDLLPDLVDDNTYFIITVGQIKNCQVRKNLAQKLHANCANMATIISPLAHVSIHSSVEEGSIVMHHAVVNANVRVGKNCIINTKSSLEHGVIIEDFCHISTSSVVNGESIIRSGTFVGSNATISNNVIVEEDSVIGAGKFIK
jgi:sugar O-acyltransferase (sialic acid O-acetyltransferase NeuD family)